MPLKIHYSLYKVSFVPARRNIETTIDNREIYALEFRSLEESIEDKNLIFIDEVGFAVSTRTSKGRSLIGTQANLSVPAVRTRNISIFAAMNKYGMIIYEVFKRPINGEDFKTCLVNLKERCDVMSIKNQVFIMDNARIHHYCGLHEIIQRMGLRMVYLPPYSPFMNPIENCFLNGKIM